MISHKHYFEEVGIWPKNSTGVLVEYIFGVLLSIVLTVAAYYIVTYEFFSPTVRVSSVIGLILLQLVVQIRYFLHLNVRRSSWQRLGSLVFALLIVGILLTGSLWIMKNLNDRMMPTSEQMNKYMQRNSGL